MFAIKNSHLILSGPYLTIGKIDRQPLLGRGRGTRAGTGSGTGGGIDGRFKATSREGASPAPLHSTTDRLLFNWTRLFIVWQADEFNRRNPIRSNWLSAERRRAVTRRWNDQVKQAPEVSCRHCSFASRGSRRARGDGTNYFSGNSVTLLFPSKFPEGSSWSRDEETQCIVEWTQFYL